MRSPGWMSLGSLTTIIDRELSHSNIDIGSETNWNKTTEGVYQWEESHLLHKI